MKSGNAINISDVDAYGEENLHTYQQLIGKLIYFAYRTKPNIVFVVSQLSKHNADPQKDHLQAAKKVVRYLKGIMNLRLIYGQITVRNLLLYGLSGYANNNFAGDPEDRKLVIGYCFFFNGAIVLWSSKKQWTVSTSTTEAKYIALGYKAKEVVWIKKFMRELKLEVTETITLYDNNEMSIVFTKNAKSQRRMKYIDI